MRTQGIVKSLSLVLEPPGPSLCLGDFVTGALCGSCMSPSSSESIQGIDFHSIDLTVDEKQCWTWMYLLCEDLLNCILLTCVLYNSVFCVLILFNKKNASKSIGRFKSRQSWNQSKFLWNKECKLGIA